MRDFLCMRSSDTAVNRCLQFFVLYMPKTRAQKDAELESLSQKLGESDSFVLARYNAITVSELDALRKELREAGVHFKVIKRTLLKKALETRGIELPNVSDHKECLAVAIAMEDDLAPVKVLHTFKKKNENMAMPVGWLHGSMIAEEEIKILASLPGKQELRGQLVSVLAGPTRGFVSLCAENMRGFVRVLKAKSEQAA